MFYNEHEAVQSQKNNISAAKQNNSQRQLARATISVSLSCWYSWNKKIATDNLSIRFFPYNKRAEQKSPTKKLMVAYQATIQNLHQSTCGEEFLGLLKLKTKTYIP